MTILHKGAWKRLWYCRLVKVLVRWLCCMILKEQLVLLLSVIVIWLYLIENRFKSILE